MAKELVVYSKPKALASKARYVIKKGIKLSKGALALGAAAYVAGASSRRYAKAPKVGEDRDLRDMILSQPDKRQRY